jgi:UDP-N-acetylglucosamine 2-epimerase (non-hydrolysing)
MTGLEPVLISDRPRILVVYGDVNSTLAAALVAAKLNIAVAHVEAGLRSGDRTMPEEINRLLTDRVSEILFATSADAVAHLGREGVAPEKIHFVGNPMIDSLLEHMDLFDTQRVLKQIEVSAPYVVATLHRPANVDGPVQAAELVKALHASADLVRIVMPLHPRGRHQLQAAGLLSHPNITVVDPLGYGEFLGLVRGAVAAVTDSGGVQEETTILGIPCLTLRANTERPVTITHGTNRLVSVRSLPSVLAEVLSDPMPQRADNPPLWDGKAGQRIANVLLHRVASHCA